MSGAGYAIQVHVGTHCAGSDGFQRFLAANRVAIGAAGYDLACPPSAELHDGALAASAASGIRLAMAARDSGERHGLIVSDHEIVGRVNQLMRGMFYPDAGARATALRKAIGMPVDRLVLVVQPYDHLFVTAWQQHALNSVVQPFADYAGTLSGFDGGWVDLVQDLRDGLEARHVTVLAAPQDPVVLMDHLVPELRLDAPMRPEVSAPVTETAIAMAQRHLRMGARFAPGQRERLLAFHARQPQTPVSRGFEGLRLADLRGRYVADMDWLSRQPSVEVVGGVAHKFAAE